MEVKTDSYDVGIIVGRFQVPELHDAHLDLIQTVCNRHDKVVLFLGLSPVKVTRENPLDFEARKQMILEAFPLITVLYCNDQASDAVWSKKLDQQIDFVLTPTQTAVIYGSRDSFISHYSGKYATTELVQDKYISGTEARKRISKKSTKATADFRAGVVWASQSTYPKVHPTVDVAIFNDDNTKILLARKTDEKEYRLIGGFIDPGETAEQAARREVFEETHVGITDPEYVASFVIDDWRYRKEVDKITSFLFKAKHFSGRPDPNDDIVECRWFDIKEELKQNLLVVRPEHREMMTRLINQVP